MPDNIPTPPDGTEEQDPVTPQTDPVPATEDEPEDDEPIPATDPLADPEPAPAPAPAAPATPSLDERYRNSTSEAMILNSKNKNLESTLNQLTSEDTPTDTELTAAYPEYATYNPVTQKLMRDTLENKKRQLRLNRQLIEQEAERKWEGELRSITRKPEYASLRDDEKFQDFVFKPQHRGVDIQTLADAYLVRTGKAQAPAAPAPAPAAPPPSSSGIPRASGGPRGPLKRKKLSLDEARTLRETNYKEYMRQVRANNIEEDPSV